MNAETITRDQFNALGQGDIVLWRKSHFRTVLDGPRDKPGQRSVSFPILNRSWTGRITTCYDWSAAKSLIAYTGKRTRQLFNLRELERLASSGFDIPERIKYEMREFEDALNRGCQYQRAIVERNPSFCAKVMASLNLIEASI